MRWYFLSKSLSNCTDLQVFLKDNACLMKDSNVIMEIPVQTTIAFAVTELEIRHDGHFGESFEISGLVQREPFLPFDALRRPQSCA